MTRATIQEKVSNLEAELNFLKKTLLGEPDSNVDEKNWRRVRPLAKRIRKKIYKGRYGKA